MRNDRQIEFPTRKAQAACIYLAANAGASINRKLLSGLLWGNFDDAAARVSLRKALSMVCTHEDSADLVTRDRATVQFNGDPAKIDIAVFLETVARRTERSYRTALSMWRGEPLLGAEIGEPGFDDWIREFRSTTVSQIHHYLSEQRAEMENKAPAPTQIALCELIVRIEPADIPASERLMRLYAAEANTVAAARRYRALSASLADLDIPMPEELKAFASSLRAAVRGDVPTDTEIAPYNGIPTVALQRPTGMRPTPDLFAYAHSEVMCQLTRFRSMRCFEPLPPVEEGGAHGDRDSIEANASRLIHLSGDLKHDYRLLLWNEPNARALYLRCVNARRQDTVSCVRLGYDELEDRQQAERIIATAVNTIEQDILNDEPAQPDSPFSRWLEAFRQLQQFTSQGDRLALEILTDLAEDPRGSRLSLVHSSIGALVMKRRMYTPTTAGNEDDIFRAKASVDRALSLDSHEPFNHVIAGWWSMQSRDHERALGAFDNALALNPFSSRTLISAAEAKAFCGDLVCGRALAERAMELSGRYAPAYFHSYLANIEYLSGNLEECLSRLQRSPENLHTVLLTMAVHQEQNETVKLDAARVRLDRELRRAEREQPFDYTALSRWVVTSYMTRDPGARRRLFGSLEAAGVPVSGATAR
ncbi:MAG: hypothetical protein AAGJ94_05235 [Pseudomonadota bacterium]